MNETMTRNAAEELEDALRDAPPLHEQEMDGDLSAREILRSSSKRRAFLQRMGMAGLGMSAIALLNGCNDDDDDGGPNPGSTATPGGTASGTATPGGTAQATGTARPGIDQTNFPGIIGTNINFVVLNYALALETLEADLYRQSLNAASRLPIDTPLQTFRTYGLRVPAGALNTGAGTPAVAFKYLRDFAFVEATHRDFLRIAIRSLGGTPQPRNPGGYQYPGGPGTDLRTILTKVLPLEETGVRAYLGAAGFLTDLGLIQTASTIYSTEARHSAIVADAIGRAPGPVRQPGDKGVTGAYPSPDTFEYFLDPPTVLSAIRPYLDTDNSNGTNDDIQTTR